MLYIETEGESFERGHAVGKSAAGIFARMVEDYKNIFSEEGWGWDMVRAHVQKYFPHCSSLSAYGELRGMASGSGISEDDLFILNCAEEVFDMKSCTSIAKKTEGGVLLGHNEDWYASDETHVIVIGARRRGEPCFLSATCGAFLASVGLTDSLAQGVNSVSPKDVREGIPRVFVSRAVLDANTSHEAIELATMGNRAGGYNHLIATSDTIFSVETSATRYDILYGNQAHTNHYLSEKMRAIEKERSESSVRRYEGASFLLKEAGSVEDFKNILSDHTCGICNHGREEKTVFSCIADIGKATLHVCEGNPCEGKWRQFSLREYC